MPRVFSPDNLLPTIDPDTNFFNDSQINANCTQSTIDDFRISIENSSKGNFKIVNYNIRSFFKHIDDFICIMNSCNYDPDIIVLTETWLTDKNVDHANIEGYRVTHCIRQNANSGGVSIFYKKFSNVEELDDFTVNNGAIETCSIKLRVEGSIIYCMGFYRPNTGTVTEFLQSLNILLHKIQNLNEIKVILLGDFNINL